MALTGEGADEWLAGYPWYKIHKLLGWLDVIPGLPLGCGCRRAVPEARPGSRAFPWATYRAHAGGRRRAQRLARHLRPDEPDQAPVLQPRTCASAILAALAVRRPGAARRTCTAGTRSTGSCTSAPRIMLPGHLLARKGDRVAMHSSVETRYPFLDEDVFAFMAKLHPRWKLRGCCKDKYIERKVAERWLPKEIAWRRKHDVPRADGQLGERRADGAGRAGSTRCSRRSRCARRATSTPAAVAAAREKLAKPGRGLGRTGLEMGLTAVTATQLWHHLYLGGDLCDLPESKPTSPRPVPRPASDAVRLATDLRPDCAMSYALQTLWHEQPRYASGVLAVAFSAVLIALQCGLLLGLFTITSSRSTTRTADIWVGSTAVPSVDLGKPIPMSYLAAARRAMPGVSSAELYIATSPTSPSRPAAPSCASSSAAASTTTPPGPPTC